MGMERQDWKSLGEQILDSVSGALSTGDFSELNDLVAGTVNNVVEEVRKQADKERASREKDMIRFAQENSVNREKWEKQQEEIRRRQEERRTEWKKRQQERLQREYTEYREKEAQRLVSAANAQGIRVNIRHSNVIYRKIGSVSNVLNTVFGALGIGVAAAFGLVTLILISVGENNLPFLFVTLVFGFIFGKMLGKGAKQRGLLRRAERYIQLCGRKMYADIAELAAQTGKSIAFVKKDLKKILNAGILPQGHLDRQETCLMLTDEIYQQYTETAHAFRMRDEMEQERKNRENTAASAENAQEKEQNRPETELEAMVSEGTTYIKKLRELNDLIPGEEISNRLFQLESLLKQIFDRVREHPEQMGRMQKMMEYYLPTMVKLVEAYVDFEKVEMPGADIVNAKAEIYKTLGIINEAFVELLNNLFQDAVFDATTDAQVLQTMLAREGLRREMSAEPLPTAEKAQPEAGAQAAPTDGFRIRGIGEEDVPEPALKAPWES